MQRRQVTGLFCEDIRSEKSGAFSLVGIMPDNANIGVAPTSEKRGMFPKLCVYMRAQFDISDQVKTISMSMQLPDGNVLDMGPISADLISKSFAGAKKKGNPLAIIVLRAEFQAFPIISLGKMLLHAHIDGESYIAAQLNLVSSQDEEENPIAEETRQFTHTIAAQPISPTS